jgi:hypothetical protein
MAGAVAGGAAVDVDIRNQRGKIGRRKISAIPTRARGICEIFHKPRQDHTRLIVKATTAKMTTNPERRRIKSHVVGVWGRVEIISAAIAQ